MMKIGLIFLLSISLHQIFSVEAGKTLKLRRPRFEPEVIDLFKEMGRYNGYVKFDKCHIVPWGFIKGMIIKFNNKGISEEDMTKLIESLASIHEEAAFYQSLSQELKDELEELRDQFKKRALDELKTKKLEKMATALFNMPSNVFPGNHKINQEIAQRFDPPKKASPYGERLKDATELAKEIFYDYSKKGLTTLDDPSDPGVMVKSSDKPPGDVSGDFIKIT